MKSNKFAIGSLRRKGNLFVKMVKSYSKLCANSVPSYFNFGCKTIKFKELLTKFEESNKNKAEVRQQRHLIFF